MCIDKMSGSFEKLLYGKKWIIKQYGNYCHPSVPFASLCVIFILLVEIPLQLFHAIQSFVVETPHIFGQVS